jgi:hypothetical protein
LETANSGAEALLLSAGALTYFRGDFLGYVAEEAEFKGFPP